MSSGWPALILLLPLFAQAASAPLHTGWKLQSGCVVKSTGEQISMPDYRTPDWINAVVPGTVLGSQVAAGVFPDPFFGMNLRKIPGMDYPIGKIFGYLGDTTLFADPVASALVVIEPAARAGNLFVCERNFSSRSYRSATSAANSVR